MNVRRPAWAAATLAPIAVLAACCAAFFFPLFTGHTFTTVTPHYEAVFPWRALGSTLRDVPQSDEADLTFPWRTFMGRELRRGVVPFWNPHSFGGQPFFANGSSGMLYPPNLVAALLVPPDVAHDAVSVLHVFCSGLFAFLLMREWRVGRAGALFTGVAWMLSSFNLAWLHLEVVAPVSTWLPLGLLLASRAVRRYEWWSTGAASAALACALIGGHLLFGGVVYGTVLVYAAGLTLARGLGWREASDELAPIVAWRTLMARLAVLAAGPLLLGAVVLLPTGLYLAGLERGSIGYEQFHEAIRVPYSTFRYLVTPPPLPATEGTLHGMVFLGALTPVLALTGLVRRGPGTVFAPLLVVTVFLVVTDTLLLKWAYAVFPLFSFFSPLGRLLNLFNLGMAVLAGMGLDVVIRRLRPAAVAAAVTAVAVTVTAWQLGSYGRAVNPPFVPREARWLYPPTPLIDALVAHGAANGTRPGRILPIRPSLTNGWRPPVLYAAESLVFGIDSLGGYDSTLPPRAENVIRIVSGEPVAEVLARTYRRAFTTSFEIDRLRFDLLPRLGVTTLVAPPGLSADPLWAAGAYRPLVLTPIYAGEDGEAFRIDGASGGPWLVHEVAAVRDGVRAVEIFTHPGFDPSRRVILEQRDLTDPALPVDPPARPSGGEVQAVEDGVNTLRLAARSVGGPAWVVVPNVWERGWTATVNGRRTPVLRANYVFQAVPVPEGTSDVHLEYRPPGLLPGLAISGGSLLGFAIVLRRRHRQRVEGSDPAASL